MGTGTPEFPAYEYEHCNIITSDKLEWWMDNHPNEPWEFKWNNEISAIGQIAVQYFPEDRPTLRVSRAVNLEHLHGFSCRSLSSGNGLEVEYLIIE